MENKREAATTMPSSGANKSRDICCIRTNKECYSLLLWVTNNIAIFLFPYTANWAHGNSRPSLNNLTTPLAISRISSSQCVQNIPFFAQKNTSAWQSPASLFLVWPKVKFNTYLVLIIIYQKVPTSTILFLLTTSSTMNRLTSNNIAMVTLDQKPTWKYIKMWIQIWRNKLKQSQTKVILKWIALS